MPKINFTRKCILMSVISKEKNLILVNSFNNIPFVKLYTTNNDYENFIYSKIKGALCFFMNKDPNKVLFYLRIYDIKNYSIVFNMELKKEHLKYFTQYSDNFYFMQLRESLLGFGFSSIIAGKNFHQILKVEPNKEILEQNEKALAIKPKEISKNINKVSEAIKLKLRNKFQDTMKKGGGGWFSKKEESYHFPHIEINDKKGEYLDLSNIPNIYIFFKNVEISDILSKMVIFPERKLPKALCQKYILKYDNSYDFYSINSPLKIIEKDFLNIANKKIYINIWVSNMINDMKMHERLDIFKKEHIKRTRKKEGYKIHKKKTNKSCMSRKTRDFSTSRHTRNLSRVSSESSLFEETTNSRNDARSSISSNSGLSGLYNTNDNHQRYKSKDKYSNDRESINELNIVTLDNMMDSDDDNSNNEAGFKYFADDKKKKPVQTTKKKAPDEKTLKKSVSSDYILGNKKDNSKKSKKKAEDIMNFLGGDSVAIPEMDEDEGENKTKAANTPSSNQVTSNIYVNNKFKNKINVSSKSSLTGFLMTTNKLGKNKK